MGASWVTYRIDVDDVPKRMRPGGHVMDREIMMRHMIRGMHESVDIIEDQWLAFAEPHRDTGEYDEHLRTQVSVAGNEVYGDVWNDAAHADFLERGTGLYRHGPGSRGMIRPSGPSGVLVFHSKLLGKLIVTKAVRGQRAKWLGRRARIASRLRVKIAQQAAARAAANEMRASL